ncbi:MAG TPA: hypothetical protein VM598_08515, partial [Bdellovibrionota bacterium]|nr:hypothetical protein [Bdellovibrionota bacterium]
MMKILLLNPHIDAEHKIAALLRSKGFAVLVASDTEEGWQACQSHGTSLDLAVIHREWGKEKDGGIRFIEKLKADAVQSDLPFILTSEDWNEVECAIHQKSANGANAYLRWPFDGGSLLEVVQKIFPDSLLPGEGTGTQSSMATQTEGQGTQATQGIGTMATQALGTQALGTQATQALSSDAGPNLEMPSLQSGLSMPSNISNAITYGPGIGVAPTAQAPKSPAAGPPKFSPPAMGGADFTSAPPGGPILESPTTPSLSVADSTSPKLEFTTPQLEAGNGMMLEDVSSLISRGESDKTKPSDMGIVLEAPIDAPDVTSGTGQSGGVKEPDLSQLSRKSSEPELTMEPALGELVPAMDTNATKVAGQPIPPPRPKAKPPVAETEEGTGAGTMALGTLAIPSQESDASRLLEPSQMLDPSQLLAQDEPRTRAIPTEPSPVEQTYPEPGYDIAADREVAAQMPYLFRKTAGAQGGARDAPTPLPSLLGDAVIPGAAGESPDVETLKKYLTLREHDVAVLSSQLKLAHEKSSSLEDALKMEKAQNAELLAAARQQKQKLEEFDRNHGFNQQQMMAELDELKFQLKVKTDQARVLESRANEAQDEIEKLKERVRSDIRKIRVHEKELENRLEILKKDSEALIGAREQKIIELKRKLD